MIAALVMFALAQAPLDTDTPTLAPDLPGISVRLRAGEVAPFDGRLVELEENRRRGAALVDCRTELAVGKTNEWLSKPALVALIAGTAAASAALAAGVTVWAMKR